MRNDYGGWSQSAVNVLFGERRIFFSQIVSTVTPRTFWTWEWCILEYFSYYFLQLDEHSNADYMHKTVTDVEWPDRGKQPSLPEVMTVAPLSTTERRHSHDLGQAWVPQPGPGAHWPFEFSQIHVRDRTVGLLSVGRHSSI